ncbi:MAG: YaaC family protein [Candidatus Woesearchaeota archaeon]
MSKKIYTFDYQKEIWSLLGLFESKKYVEQKLKNKFTEINEEEVNYRTENLTYCVRQAREFFNSANEVSLLTSPLLLSYGMLNLAKALVYFHISIGTDFSNYFNMHGLTVPQNGDLELFTEESIEFKSNGTYPQMVAIYNESSFAGLSITTKDILSQIPELYDLYVYIYNESPNITPVKSIDYGYSILTNGYYDKINEKLRKTLDILEIEGYQFSHYRENISVRRYMSADKSLEEMGFLFNSISGKKFFRFPVIKENKLLFLKENSLHYLLIFCYGMLARYQAAKWGKYIDPNISKEAEIINKSIYISQRKYLHIIINFLLEEDFEFKFSVGEKQRDKEEIIKLIYDDIKDQLINDISSEIRRRGGF